jgi:hypothetical protein
MPENIGSGSNPPYNTKIPRIDENADIQTALRLYHYGSDTSTPGTIVAESIAGHLNSLETKKLNSTPGIITNNQNLDDYTTTGFFVQPSTPNARTGLNYPEARVSALPGAAIEEFAGILTVINLSGTIIQQYQMVDGIDKKTYWRSRYSNVWSAWQSFVNPTDVTAEVEKLTHLKGVTWTRDEMAARFSPRLFTENSYTANVTLSTLDINRVVSVNAPSAATVTIPLNSSADIPVGSVINVYNRSASLLTIQGFNSDVIVRNAGTLEQYKEASLRKRDTDEWVAAGPLY